MGVQWNMADGGNIWAMRGGITMPAVADPVRMSVGDVRLIVADFGNLAELQPLTSAIASSAPITVSPAEGVAVATQTVGAYTVSAWYTATAPGQYTVSVPVTLADGTTLVRKGELVVE